MNTGIMVLQAIVLKSLLWADIGRIDVTDSEIPHPGKGEVLIKVKYCGICGSELSAYTGHNELRKPPSVMGHEFSGNVVEAGDSSLEWMVGKLVAVNPLVTCGRCRFCASGDRQLCLERKIIGVNFSGGFGQYVSVPSYSIHEMNDALYGSLAEPLACAVRAVRQARVTVGDTVLIAGAGTIGLLSAKMAIAAGASEVVMAETNSFRRELSLKYGATAALAPDKVEEHLDRTGNRNGFDRAIDAVGYNESRNLLVRHVRRGGTVSILGLHENRMDLDGNYVVRSETSVSGSFCYSNEDFRVATDFINRGKLKGAEKWFEVRGARAADKAFQDLLKPDCSVSKVILDMEDV